MPHLFPIDRYLNVRAATSPSFSPDGQHVAYVSNTTGIPQAWLIPTFGGEPIQLTFGPDAVRGVHFSPTRPELIFSMDRGGDRDKSSGGNESFDRAKCKWTGHDGD